MTNFREELSIRYWKYQMINFPEVETYFDRSFAPNGRPPVFRRDQARKNVITNPEASQEEINHLFRLVPEGERHKWFRSMNSSQALAQSVFGNLVVHGYLEQLTDLVDDTGSPLFGKARVYSENFHMEYKIRHLGEPRPTSLDGFVSGKYRVAIEFKFTESEFGSCSRPLLTPLAANYEADYCDGNYIEQRARKERCSLTEVGVLYWRYIPFLFHWQSTVDNRPCPVNNNYQLVRNVLAACIDPEYDVSDENGHVVVVYDERNPAFQLGGKALSSYEEVRNALKNPTTLRMCSWQQITKHLRHQDILPWLTEQLELKYGL